MPPRPAAPKTAFVCQQCGNDYPKWIGKCPSCGGWNTLVEERIVAPQKGRPGPARAPRVPVALDEVPALLSGATSVPTDGKTVITL